MQARLNVRGTKLEAKNVRIFEVKMTFRVAAEGARISKSILKKLELLK